MKPCITYMNTAHYLRLTPAQEKHLRAAGVWPRDERGAYCDVSHGLHRDEPSLTDDQIAGLVAGDEVEINELRTIVAR